MYLRNNPCGWSTNWSVCRGLNLLYLPAQTSGALDKRWAAYDGQMSPFPDFSLLKNTFPYINYSLIQHTFTQNLLCQALQWSLGILQALAILSIWISSNMESLSLCAFCSHLLEHASCFPSFPMASNNSSGFHLGIPSPRSLL